MTIFKIDPNIISILTVAVSIFAADYNYLAYIAPKDPVQI
jgi:hypothetical protein